MTGAKPPCRFRDSASAPPMTNYGWVGEQARIEEHEAGVKLGRDLCRLAPHGDPRRNGAPRVEQRLRVRRDRQQFGLHLARQRSGIALSPLHRFLHRAGEASQHIDEFTRGRRRGLTLAEGFAEEVHISLLEAG